MAVLCPMTDLARLGEGGLDSATRKVEGGEEILASRKASEELRRLVR